MDCAACTTLQWMIYFLKGRVQATVQKIPSNIIYIIWKKKKLLTCALRRCTLSCWCLRKRTLLKITRPVTIETIKCKKPNEKVRENGYAQRWTKDQANGTHMVTALLCTICSARILESCRGLSNSECRCEMKPPSFQQKARLSTYPRYEAKATGAELLRMAICMQCSLCELGTGSGFWPRTTSLLKWRQRQLVWINVYMYVHVQYVLSSKRRAMQLAFAP